MLLDSPLGFFYGIGGVFYRNFDVFLDFFFLSSFFINYNEKKRKKKDFEGTLQLQLRYHQYHQKDFKKRNSPTAGKIINGARVDHTSRQS
jgi:hypothetical protein